MSASYHRSLSDKSMAYRQFTIGEAEKKDILLFDVLYRLNAKLKMSVLLDREQSFLEDSFKLAFQEGYLEINDDSEYELSEAGKEKLLSFGQMFQRFKDMAIFKCVHLEREAPEEGQPDHRFGSIQEEANPPESEDLRVMIFENFCKRENRQAPLHLFVFFSLIENLNLEENEADWIWALANGSIWKDLEEVINSQIHALDICPDGWSENEITDEIYHAGMSEFQRCLKIDQEKFSREAQNQSRENFWKEDVRYHDEDPWDDDYYDPYWQPQVGVGTAFCVGAFTGLAACALLS